MVNISLWKPGIWIVDVNAILREPLRYDSGVTNYIEEYVDADEFVITPRHANDVRDRSLFIVQGGIEEKLGGGALNFLKSERDALEKYRETKEGGLWKDLPVWKNISSFKNVSQNNLTTNNNVYRPLIFINGSQKVSYVH
jgi:hypothetical protein